MPFFYFLVLGKNLVNSLLEHPIHLQLLHRLPLNLFYWHSRSLRH